MGTFRRNTLQEIASLIDATDWSIIPGFRLMHYMLLDDGLALMDGRVSECCLHVLENAPYKIGGVPCAVWDMRRNSAEWDKTDIYCGLLHEMFHCCQIEHEIHTEGAKLRGYSLEDRITFVEGAALYVELRYKSEIRGATLDELLGEYYGFAVRSSSENLKYYYAGADRINRINRTGSFSWPEYFSSGTF